MSQYNYDTPEGRVAALRDIKALLDDYTDATRRLAFPDAILYDVLAMRELDYGSGASYTVKSAEHAFTVLEEKNVGLSIDAYFWDGIEDQVSDLLDEHDLAEPAGFADE
jgi:hypothetical protein